MIATRLNSQTLSKSLEGNIILQNYRTITELNDARAKSVTVFLFFSH
jgi:hypothetical protein